jgi:hypothetical protein
MRVVVVEVVVLEVLVVEVVEVVVRQVLSSTKFPRAASKTASAAIPNAPPVVQAIITVSSSNT